MTLLIFAAACGGTDGAPLTLDGYIGEIEAIVAEFEASERAADAMDFPIDGEMVQAATSYMAYEASLEAMRSIEPPTEIAAQHERVVSTLAEVQEVVGDYLEKASVEGGFTFASLNADPTIAARLRTFSEACEELAIELVERGVEGVPPACGLLDS